MLQSSTLNPTFSGAISAVNQSVSFTVNRFDSSWSVQVTGTFVGTMQTELSINGSDFIPVAFRRSQSGTVGSKITIPGIYRGNCGASAVFQVRATAWTSGTANISIKGGETGAVFLNTFVEVRELAQYYSSATGGRRAFNVTSGVVNATGLTTVMILHNPTNSPIDTYVQRMTLSNSTNGIWTRMRNTNITPTGAALADQNRGGGTTIPSTKAYLAAAATVGAGGVSSSTTHSGAFVPLNFEDNGNLILLPGQAIVWQFTPNTGSGTASVNCVFWEAELTT